jgi:hypothetical protein
MKFLWYLVVPALSFLFLRRSIIRYLISVRPAPTTTSRNGEWTRHEIYHIAFLMRQKLPAELVPAILDHAEFWVKATTAREHDLAVTEGDLIQQDDGDGGTREEGVPYLFTDPIGMEGLTGLHPVRKVVFTIESRDQGYSWDQEWHGTYQHSWTWFEGVVANFEAEDDAPLGNGKRILCNLHAGGDFSEHVVEWDTISEGDTPKYVFSEGGEAEWVRGLTRGQRVGITVWAKFGGWINYVKAARIDVYTAAVR